MNRRRLWWGIALLLVLLLGLASRKASLPLLGLFGKYPGDALWAVAVMLAFAVIKPYASLRLMAGVGLCVSYLTELSQLYQRPWINAIRRTTTGHLFLGSTFSPFDMLAYTAGIGLAVSILVAANYVLGRPAWKRTPR